MRVALAFALSLLVVFVAVGAVAIFAFGYFEGAWGRWNSLQVYVWIAVPVSIVAGLGAWVGTRLAAPRHTPSLRHQWAGAILFAALATGAAWLAGYLWGGALFEFALCFLGALGFSALWLRRWGDGR